MTKTKSHSSFDSTICKFSNIFLILLPVGDLFDTNPSAETLTRPIEAYEDPLNHSEPKYAEVDSTMTESKWFIDFYFLNNVIILFIIIEYDHLNYLQQNTKKHLSYDKLKILDEEKVQNWLILFNKRESSIEERH